MTLKINIVVINNKIILTALFLGTFVSANAVETNITDPEPELECHMEACIAIEEAEKAFPEYEVGAEQIYSYVFSECMG